jgi:outer membrane lipoprotein LolB
MRPLFLLAGAALAAAGCVRMEVVDDGLGFDRRQAALAAVPDWDIRGRIAVSDGDSSYQGRLRWDQRGDELNVVVSGALGARSFRIRGSRSSLTVESRGETEVLTDPERQLSEMLGWWLPVTSAEHWLLGHADPDFAFQSTRGRFDALASLSQRDWQIGYEAYQRAGNLLIPRTIRLTNGPLELIVTIIEWESVDAAP